MWPNLQETADLITFTKEILHGKLYFFFVQCFFTIRTPLASRYNIFLYAATIKCGFPQGSQFNPVQAFLGYSQIGGGLPKICHTYPTMIKLSSHTLPKEGPKNIRITCHTSWALLTSTFFHRKSATLVLSRNTDVDCILTHNF